MSISTEISYIATNIFKGILGVLKFHLIFSGIIFIFVIGAQLFSWNHIRSNLAILNDVKEKEIKIKFPSDGWIRTIIISLIPIYNIEYTVFVVMLGLMPENSNYIIKRRDLIREVKKYDKFNH